MFHLRKTLCVRRICLHLICDEFFFEAKVFIKWYLIVLSKYMSVIRLIIEASIGLFHDLFINLKRTSTDANIIAINKYNWL